MTDPDDINTFETVAYAENNTATYRRYYTNFMEYTGNGKYIAVRWVINENGGATGSSADSYPHIDDVLIQELGDCLTPNIKVDSVTTETATLSWSAFNMDNFTLVIDSLATRTEAALDELTEDTKGVYYIFNVTDTNAITLPKGKLRYGRTYYAYIRSVCDNDEASYWSAPISVTTNVPEIFTLPFTETFESYGTSTGSMAAGWIKKDPEASYPYLTSSGHTGSASLYMYNYSSTTSATEVYSPAFEMDDFSEMMISFWGKASSAASATYPDSLYIGVGNNPTDTNDVITWLDTVWIPTTSYAEYRVLLAGWQPGMGNRVVFSNINAKSNTLYLDDITFQSVVNATPYEIETLSATDTEATFTWTGRASKGWRAVVTTTPINPDTVAKVNPAIVLVDSVVNTQPMKITGLTPQTNYYVYLKAVEGNTDWSEEHNILTQCMKLTPSRTFKMTFEGWLPDKSALISSYANSTFPDCWIRHGADEDRASVSYTPIIYQLKEGTALTSTSNVHDGLAAARLYTSSTYYPSWFTTPELNAKDMSNVTVRFWARASSTSYGMEFGVMVDPDDFSTYTKLVDILPGHTAWTQYTFLLDDYGYKPEMGNYIVFAQSQAKAWTFYIDDVEISESTCRPAKPVLSKLTHNSVRLAYAAEPTNMRVLLAKDYALNVDSLNLYDSLLINVLKEQGAIILDTIVEGKAGIPFNNLSSSTYYSAAMLTLCENETSSWIVKAWTTMCEPNAIEDLALIDFEVGYNDTSATSLSSVTRPVPCWVTGNKSTQTQTYIPYVVNGTVAPDGAKSLKFYTTTSYNGAYAIMPAVDVDSITKYEMTFMGRATTSNTSSKPTSPTLSATYMGDIIVGVVTDPSDISTFVAVDTVDLKDTDAHKCKVRFSAYKGDANQEYGKFIAFMSEFNATNIFFVDNISVSLIDPCGEPLDIDVDTIGVNDAVVSWNGNTPAYRVVVSAEELSEKQWENYENYIVDDTIQATQYQLTELSGNTQYYVYIKALCSETEGKWNLDGVTFITNCPDMMPLPWDENFDRYTKSASTKNPPSCVATFYNGSMTTSSTYTDAAKRPTMATLPIEDISKVMISFKLKASGSAAQPSVIALGYATDISCIDSLIATVQYFDTVSPGISSTNWIEYQRDLKDVQGKNVHLVLSQLYVSSSGTTLYMDDLKVEKTPTCFTPKASVVTTGYNDVTLEITPFLEDDNAWDVMIISQNEEDTIVATIDTTTAVVNGLTYSTSYTMYVRTNCGEGDVSAWSDPLTYNTLYKIGAGTKYTFEIEDGAIRTPLSTSDTYIAHPSLYIGPNMTATGASYMPYQVKQTATAKKARTGEYSMQFYHSSSYQQAWMALPIILGADSLQMRFDMRGYSFNATDTVIDSNHYGAISYMQIGTIDEDYNLDSYEVLAEFRPSTLPVGDKSTEAKNLLFDQFVVPMPSNLDGKLIVMMNASKATTSYLYVDNLLLEKKQGWQTPVITTSTITPDSLTVNWNAPGSTKWNVYLTQDTTHFPLVNIPAENILSKKEGLTSATATFTGLKPNTEYYVYVQIAGESDIAATSVRRGFKTPMDVKISTDSILTFEGSNNNGLSRNFPMSATVGDTMYVLPTGWYSANMSNVAHAYIPRCPLNDYAATGTSTSKGVSIAYKGERALQLYSGVNNNRLGAYAVMPEVDGDYDTLQVNFFARPFSGSTTGKVAIAGSTYKNKPLVVGTMTDPNNPETFEVIDSLYYSDITLTTSVNLIDLYHEGYQSFSFRLGSTKGKYIAFSAPIAGQWYIDNISFSGKTCLPPTKVNVSNITKTSAEVTWKAIDGNNCVIQMSKAESFAASTILLNDTVAADEIVYLTGLDPLATYYIRIAELCDAVNVSDWATTSFTTECPETDLNYTCGFEVTEGRVHQGSSTSTTYDITSCWTTWTTYVTTSYYSYVPRVQNSSGTTYYSRNTSTSNLESTGSLRMYAYASSSSTSSSSSYYDQWAVMPHLDVKTLDTDSVQLEFYALPGAYDPNTGLIKTTYTADNYLPSIVVGVMSDPYDISTFVALDTCTYSLGKLTTSTVATPENDFMFQHFIVPLTGIKGKGEYLAFKTYLIDWIESKPTRPTSTMYTQIYLDDVSLQPLNECFIPEDLAVSDILVSSATLSWKGEEGASWVVNVSQDPTFQDKELAALYNDTVTEMSISVQGLDTMTTYYWNVYQICGPASSSVPSNTMTFKTARVPLFHEEFIETTIPVDWMRDTTRACYVFNGAPIVGKGTSYAWALDAANYGINGRHMAAPMNSGTPTSTTVYAKKSWFMTPVVYLDSVKDAWLTFYAALNYYGKDEPAEKNGWDDQFMVVISEDGGETWKRENATIWNNETSNDPTDPYYVYGKGDYVLNDLPYSNDKSMPIYIDLAKYKGKGIKVGFYSESMKLNAYNELHIGDVHINYVTYVEDAATSCQFEDLVSTVGGFNLNGDQYTAGTYELKKIDLASLNDLRDNPNHGLVDTLYTFTATFIEAPQVIIEKTICEGEVAGKEWGFEDKATTGIYRRKGVSAVTGCDSITTLQLTVIPRIYTEEEVAICTGTSYEFNGKFYNETGVYVDTLSSVVTGCDSITTLILTINPPLTYEFDAYICTGTTYNFTEKYPALTLSGKYVDTLQTEQGCDSIVTLNLTVSEKIDIQLYDTVCQGESFFFEGKEYDKPGVYTLNYESVAGCDSIVTLNFTWNKVDTVVVDTTIYDWELPYMYPNADITYPKGTQPGEYIDTVKLSVEGNECGYVLVHKLTVLLGSAVNNVVTGDLLIQPSIIAPGESVTISGLGGEKVTVEIYDMVGRCVAQQPMTGKSLELNTFNTAGIYMVRVSNENGDQYVGRVIVK